MMALLNNWDLRDTNNGIYGEKAGPKGPEQIYIVSDLGASFGTRRRDWPLVKAKGNLEASGRRQANALGAKGEPIRFCVTHPYHPLCGQTFELAAQNKEFGEDRVFNVLRLAAERHHRG